MAGIDAMSALAEEIDRLRAAGSVHVYSDGPAEYDVYALWLASEGAAVTAVPLDTLRPQLDGPCWGPFLSPAMVLAGEAGDPRYASHWRRILAADTAHPLILAEDGHVVDGMHRLCRLVLEGAVAAATRRATPAMMAAARLPAGEGGPAEGRRGAMARARRDRS
jgi:hypothetical protein